MIRKGLIAPLMVGALLFSALGGCMALDGLALPPEVLPEMTPEVAPTPSTQVAVAAKKETETQKLYRLLNAYRAEKGLVAIPYSAKLAKTALTHAQDLRQHRPHKATASDGSPCNLHSWSDQGSWTPVCYTRDHREAKKMWSKPREVAGYKANGFEISAYSTGCQKAECWLDQWKRSSGHNQVIINGGIWADSTWRAVGIGLDGDFAHIWFGELADD